MISLLDGVNDGYGIGLTRAATSSSMVNYLLFKGGLDGCWRSSLRCGCYLNSSDTESAVAQPQNFAGLCSVMAIMMVTFSAVCC